MSKTKRDRIVEARMKLRARFKNKIEASPSVSDGEPLGSGPLNRHGMPQLPVGQFETQQWPVLDLGVRPGIVRDTWSLVIDGLVERPLELGWTDLMALEQVEDVSDFHCVTTWSKFDLKWGGVRVSTLLALAGVDPAATHLMCYGADEYTTNVAMEEALKDDVLLVHTYEGQPLPEDHGGPVRMITPQLYAWKGAKWICRIEVMSTNRPGFWETRGYSMTAYPWRDDRYS